MADRRVDELTATTSPALTDLVYVEIDPAGSQSPRKCTIANLGVNAVAAQSDMETATSVSLLVTPGRAVFHPGAAKGRVTFESDGSASVLDSWNVDSVTDNATGDFTVTWTDDFSNDDYQVCGIVEDNAGGGAVEPFLKLRNGGRLEGSTRVEVRAYNGSAYNTATVSVVVFGDR